MIKLNLNSPAVEAAFNVLQEEHQEYDAIKFAKIFEDVYHCKIVADPNDPFCNQGWIEIPEEKYHTWFVMRFGG